MFFFFFFFFLLFSGGSERSAKKTKLDGESKRFGGFFPFFFFVFQGDMKLGVVAKTDYKDLLSVLEKFAASASVRDVVADREFRERLVGK